MNMKRMKIKQRKLWVPLPVPVPLRALAALPVYIMIIAIIDQRTPVASLYFHLQEIPPLLLSLIRRTGRGKASKVPKVMEYLLPVT